MQDSPFAVITAPKTTMRTLVGKSFFFTIDKRSHKDYNKENACQERYTFSDRRFFRVFLSVL